MTITESEFFEACRKGDLEKVSMLASQDPTLINVEDHKGFTPLIIAVYNDSEEVVKFLLAQNARPEMHDMSGNTALMGACFKGYKEIARMLITAGAEVNQRNGNGATALT